MWPFAGTAGVPRSPKDPNDASQWESSWSERNLADCNHPLVRAHPDTGVEALYLNLNRMACVHGLDEGESVELLNRLQQHCEAQPGAILTHKWRLGDFVIFDNAVVQHRAEGKHTMKPGEPRSAIGLRRPPELLMKTEKRSHAAVSSVPLRCSVWLIVELCIDEGEFRLGTPSVDLRPGGE